MSSIRTAGSFWSANRFENRFKFACLALLLLISLASVTPAYGQIRTVEDLLNSESRPTMVDLRRVFPELPELNPFTPLAEDKRIAELADAGPEYVARVLYAHPGAIYAPLGRDSAFIADLLEGYFLAARQSGRVVRLGASTGSFVSGFVFGADDAPHQFLVSSGLTDPQPNKYDRFVILDRTTLHEGSQSRKLLREYYRRAQAAGLDPAEVQTRVNIIAMSSGQMREQSGHVIDLSQGTISLLTPRERLFSRFATREPGPAGSLFAPATFNQGPSVTSDEIAWHGSFGPFTRAADGRTVARPGRRSSEAERRHVLYVMFEVAKATERPSFREKVETLLKYSADPQTLLSDRLSTSLSNDESFDLIKEIENFDRARLLRWWRDGRRNREPAFRDLVDARAIELLLHSLLREKITEQDAAAILKTIVSKSRAPAETLVLFRSKAFELVAKLDPSRLQLLDAALKASADSRLQRQQKIEALRQAGRQVVQLPRQVFITRPKEILAALKPRNPAEAQFFKLIASVTAVSGTMSALSLAANLAISNPAPEYERAMQTIKAVEQEQRDRIAAQQRALETRPPTPAVGQGAPLSSSATSPSALPTAPTSSTLPENPNTEPNAFNAPASGARQCVRSLTPK